MNSRKLLSTLIIILSLLGIVFSILTILTHYSVEDNFFCLTGEGTCDVVNKSVYSTLFSIPLGFLGIFYFLATIYLTGKMYLGRYYRESIKYLFIWTGVGLIPVAYLIYVEAFKLLTFCSLCTVIHLITGFNFVLAFLLAKRIKLLN
jgi:uncharacterized membrane protein